MLAIRLRCFYTCGVRSSRFIAVLDACVTCCERLPVHLLYLGSTSEAEGELTCRASSWLADREHNTHALNTGWMLLQRSLVCIQLSSATVYGLRLVVRIISTGIARRHTSATLQVRAGILRSDSAGVRPQSNLRSSLYNCIFRIKQLAIIWRSTVCAYETQFASHKRNCTSSCNS